MTVEVHVANPAELAAAAAIHFECLPGNNDDGRGESWSPLGEGENRRWQVVLVAVDAGVVGYVYGDEGTEGSAVCREVAVTAEHRLRQFTRPLLGAFARYAIAQWQTDCIFLQPIESEWLTEFYVRVGFAEEPDGSGWLRIEASDLALLWAVRSTRIPSR